MEGTGGAVAPNAQYLFDLAATLAKAMAHTLPAARPALSSVEATLTALLPLPTPTRTVAEVRPELAAGATSQDQHGSRPSASDGSTKPAMHDDVQSLAVATAAPRATSVRVATRTGGPRAMATASSDPGST